jgi:DNA-binding MarR family transcriptional regulator
MMTTAKEPADRYRKPADEEVRRLEVASRFVNVFRMQDSRMTSSYMAAFLAVARNPGQGPTEYAKVCGTIQPIMSRILLELGEHARQRSAGLGLVDRVPDPGNLRQQRYFLTNKGRVVYRELMEVLGQLER